MERVEINQFRAGLLQFPVDILTDSSDVTVISLDVNEIETIPDEISKLASSLEEFSMGGNKLSQLPESLSLCSHLKVLLLPGNQLTHLPESFGQLVHLEILNLSHNQIQTLPDALSALVRVRRLTLTENNLKIFPQCITEMSSLEFLDVSGNPEMGRIPAELSQLDKMIRFNASACGLEEWPLGAAGGLKALKHLFLSVNCLQTLPDDFDQISQLVELDIGYNNISVVPDSLTRMAAQLRLLHCSGNPIQISSSLQNTFKGYSNSDSNIPDEILTLGQAKLWLGPISASHNVHFLRSQRIGHIVSVIKDRKPVFPNQFKYLWIAEDDVNAADLRQYFEQAINFITDALQSPESGGVLVHWSVFINTLPFFAAL
jgi:Leucine-rich repeat (LRR) protein